jgi:DNA-binding NarL/FixJ family response regulator
MRPFRALSASRTIESMQEPDPGPVALRVLVVDADDRVRESLTGLLGIGQRVVVVGSAGQPGPALDLVASEAPDVVMVDPRLPEIDGGVAFIGRLRALAPDVRVLVMGWADGLESGPIQQADGFVRKTFRPSELIAAILAAAAPPA